MSLCKRGHDREVVGTIKRACYHCHRIQSSISMKRWRLNKGVDFREAERRRSEDLRLEKKRADLGR